MEEINIIISETKESVIKLKEEVQALDIQAMELGKEFQEVNKKRDEIENKESAQYKLQDSISNQLLEELRGVNEKSQELKNKAIEKINIAQSKCEAIKENIAKKVLEDKNRIEKEIAQFSELIRKDKEENNVPETDQIIQNRMKKILSLQEKLSEINENGRESTKIMSEIDSKIQFLNYDDIEKISVGKVEVKQEEKEEQEKAPEQVIEIGNETIKDMGRDYGNVDKFNNRDEGEFYNEGEELPSEQVKGLWSEEDEIEPKDSGIKIKIIEKDETIQYTDNTGNNKEISIADLYKEKKDMYKRLEIGKKCREAIKNAGGRGLGFMLKRKVNPEIIKILDATGNRDLIQDYIESIYSKKKLPFELTHDLSGLSIAEKFIMRKYTKAEEKCGAKILGKLFNRNKALPEGEKDIQKIVKNTESELAENVQGIMEEDKAKGNAPFVKKVDGKNEEVAKKYRKNEGNGIEKYLNVLDIRDSVKNNIMEYVEQNGMEAARKNFPGVFSQAEAKLSRKQNKDDKELLDK